MPAEPESQQTARIGVVVFGFFFSSTDMSEMGQWTDKSQLLHAMLLTCSLNLSLSISQSLNLSVFLSACMSVSVCIKTT